MKTKTDRFSFKVGDLVIYIGPPVTDPSLPPTTYDMIYTVSHISEDGSSFYTEEESFLYTMNDDWMRVIDSNEANAIFEERKEPVLELGKCYRTNPSIIPPREKFYPNDLYNPDNFVVVSFLYTNRDSFVTSNEKTLRGVMSDVWIPADEAHVERAKALIGAYEKEIAASRLKKKTKNIVTEYKSESLPETGSDYPVGELIPSRILVELEGGFMCYYNTFADIPTGTKFKMIRG